MQKRNKEVVLHALASSSQPIKIDYKIIRISKTPSNILPNLKQENRVIRDKKPSRDLISCIEEFGNSCGSPKTLHKKIREKGMEEGFSDLEINLIARDVLRRRLSKRQLNYWFPLKGTWKKKEDSSDDNLQFAQNDGKKDIVKSQIAVVASEPGEDRVLPPGSLEKYHEGTISSNLSSADKGIVPPGDNSRRSITFLNLPSPETIDCTNHPMYIRAQEKIVQLKQVLLGKNDLIKQLRVKDDQRTLNGTSLGQPAEGIAGTEISHHDNKSYQEELLH
jgi:hypothetical protein